MLSAGEGVWDFMVPAPQSGALTSHFCPPENSIRAARFSLSST